MTTNNLRNISYLNKSFNDFKTSLIDYSKTYFPTSYNDYSEASIGMMFIELASYIGDNLSFYLDTQTQENQLSYTKELDNIINMAYTLGYRPKMSYASNVELKVYQLVPNKTVLGSLVPDYDYAFKINPNVSIASTNGINFITTDYIDFTNIYNTSASYYDPNYFLLETKVKAISAEIETATFTFTSPKKFDSIEISDTNILQILEVTDNNNDQWYEVPYLANNLINVNTLNTTSDSGSAPYILSYIQSPRRFVSRFTSESTLQLQFGAGVSNLSDTTLLPTPDLTSLGINPHIFNPINNFNKANTFIAQEYGLAPSNITLTVSYLKGGGIQSNIDSNNINQKKFSLSSNSISFNNIVKNTNDQLQQDLFNNLIFNNEQSSTGGRDADTVNEIRLNTLNSFSAQNRVVTKEDYINRTLSIPSEYGIVSKCYVENTNQKLSDNSINYNAMDLYVLGYNSSKNLTQASSTLKQNLATYLDNYRMSTDAINIKNAFIINIGIEFDITSIPQVSNRQAINSCINVLKDYFSIDKWSINQPIIISDLYSLLLKVREVQSVQNIKIINKNGNDYSQYGYDITAATKNNIIYPSLDPSIFEIKYMDNDIKGRCTTL